jgi:hypothetical protein
MKALRIDAGSTTGEHVGYVVAHDVRNAAGTKFVLRKGNAVTVESLDALRALGRRELHLVYPEPHEIHEDEAGARLARALAGPGVSFRGPFASEFTFTADTRGLLRVDVGALDTVNDLDGITVFTRFDYQPVESGEDIAGAKVTPLIIPRSTIERAEQICRARPPLRVLPFLPKRVAGLVMQRVDARARDRFQAALEVKLEWYGSELVALHEVDGKESFAQVLRGVLDERPDLVMVAGASSLDPLEPLFGALGDLGARVARHGVPVDPGSLLWLAYVGDVPFLGLASSEMFSHKTVVELILPRILAGEPVSRDDLIRLGHGGFLRREMAFRFPSYGGTQPAADEGRG